MRSWPLSLLFPVVGSNWKKSKTQLILILSVVHVKEWMLFGCVCPCGNIAQTAEHILQDCPLHAELRQQTWPKPSTLDGKLNGTEYNLTQTVEFIKAIGLQIWQDANIMGTQKKKKKKKKFGCVYVYIYDKTQHAPFWKPDIKGKNCWFFPLYCCLFGTFNHL